MVRYVNFILTPTVLVFKLFLFTIHYLVIILPNVITSLYLSTFPYMVICIYSILPVGRCLASSSHTSLGTLPYMGDGGLAYILCSTT